MGTQTKLHSLDAMDPGNVRPSVLHALPYLAPVAVLPLLAVAAAQGGWWIAGPLIFSALMEPLDSLSGPEERNMEPSGMPTRRLVFYDITLWVWVVGWPITLMFVLWQALAVGHLAAWESILVSVALGYAATVVLVASHELLHGSSAWQRWIAEILLCSIGCAPYATDHIFVHHPNVATPQDPASARKGESFWRYFPRSLSGNLVAGWRVASVRLSRRGQPVWHLSNPYWRYLAGTAAWYVLAWWMAGAWGLLIFLIVNVIALLTLRLGDYIEHYGLQRIWLPRCRFERIQLHHSWNAVGRLSNWLYYNTQRHSDHHTRPARLWPLLQNHARDLAPRFPGTYSKMFGLAMTPRRWFETMDPMVDQWRAKFYPEIHDWSVYESAAFAARPKAFEDISEIFQLSPRLRAWIESDPGLLDNLQRREFTDIELPKDFGLEPEVEAIARKGLVRLYWTHEFGVDEMKEEIEEAAIPEVRAMVELVREWTNGKVFQICVHTMRGNLSPAAASSALSNVAEASIASVMMAVYKASSLHYGVGGGGLAMILGDPATKNATPGSRLKVLFIHDGSFSAKQEALCRRFGKELRALLRGNLLFAPVHKRDEAWMCRSLDSFGEYCKQALPNELWEMAFARCIFCWGDSGVAERFGKSLNAFLDQEDIRNALRMADRQESLHAGIYPTENPTNELCQLGYVTALLRVALLIEARDGECLDPAGVFRIAGSRGWLSAETAERLAEAAELQHSLRNCIRILLDDNSFDVESAMASVRDAVARCCDMENYEVLAADICKVSSQVAQDLDELRASALGSSIASQP